MTQLHEKLTAPRNANFGASVGVTTTLPSPGYLPLRYADIRRYAKIILQSMAIFLVLGLLFHLLRGETYSSSVRMIIDHRNLQLNQDNSVLVTAAMTVPDVDNQVEILRSGNVAARAFELSAPLSQDDFLPSRGLFSRLAHLLGFAKEAQTPERLKQIALDGFRKRFTVKRIGETFTIEIAAKFHSPSGAAHIATAIANAYLEDQAHTSAEAADATSAWLRNRMKGAGITARIISHAIPPLAPDGPSLLIILVAFLMAGLGIGVAAAILQEYLFKKISTPEQARTAAHAEWMGVLPVMPVIPQVNRSINAAVSNRIIPKGAASQWPLVDPRSSIAETLNRICVAAMFERKGLKSIGVTSFLEGEGKTTVALNLARIASVNGQRVLLIDAASNTMGLSQHLSGSAFCGLSQVLSGEVELSDAAWTYPGKSFDFLPFVNDEKRFALAWLWAELSIKLTLLSQAYDLVIMDLPHIADATSFWGASQTLDGILFVIENERVRVAAAERMLSTLGQGRNNYRGVIMNKVAIR